MNKFSNYLKKKKPLLKELLNTLLTKYDFVSILGTDVKSTNFLANKSTSFIRNSSLTECGFVVRIQHNELFYEYSFNEINKKNINNLVNDIDNLIKNELFVKKIQSSKLEEENLIKNFKRNQKGKNYNYDEIINILKDDVKYALSLGDNIRNVSVRIEFNEYSKIYLSSKKELTQYYTWINPGVNIMVAREDNIKYAYDFFGTNDADEAFSHLREIIDSTYKLAVELLDATHPTPGIYTIITDPSITGLIAHEAFGHGLEMDQFVKDRAKGYEYMNKDVSSKILSMHDGAASTISAASYFFDDEGVLAQDTKIINKGILVGGICDSVSASILNYHPTGNGRRESYKHKTYTRMTNTFFEKGKSTLDEMIKSVDYGYYIATTENGMEDPKNWGIQCTALYGREIKDGSFTGKIISPVVMSGYVIDLLMSISMISKDNFTIEGSGSCGKGYKEWVRVSDGGASIKAKVKIG